jgi:hypothetical protein
MMVSIDRRQFTCLSLAAGGAASATAAAAAGVSDTPPPLIGTALPAEMKTYRDPDTGRNIRQYTTAQANSYPLYYFSPSVTADNRYAVIHSERSGWVELYRLDMESGALTQLTAGTDRDSGWFIWCEGHLRGIYNHLSALSQARREVYYFQGDEVRCTHLDTLANRVVHKMPGRISIGQSSFSPDGRYFAFIHADRSHFTSRIADREALMNMRLGPWDHEAWRDTVPTTIGVIETATGRYNDAIRLDFHVHHVIFGDNQTLLINHIKDRHGMWRIGLDGSGRRDLLPLVHQVVTARGIFYEDPRGKPVHNWFGLYDLATGKREEIELAVADGYVHTGLDPAGKFLFFENHGKTHDLVSLHFPWIKEKTAFRTIRRIAPYPGRGGQRVHAHPFLTPDRKWMMHTAVIDGYAQVCAVDVSDLVDLDEYWDRR